MLECLIGEGKMGNISLTINGKIETHDVADNTLLVDYIRENAGLTGTHVGCDTSQCGACVVHVDALHDVHNVAAAFS